jgi:hypothetical protein
VSLLFVPLSPAQLRDWAVSGMLVGELPAHTVTEELQAAFDVTDSEDSERIALLVASIAGLVATGQRLVVVADGSPRPRSEADADFGEVLIAGLGYSAVSAIFADEPDRNEVARAAAAVVGQPLDQAWEHPEVAELLSSVDLLWHGSGEWESLIAG